MMAITLRIAGNFRTDQGAWYALVPVESWDVPILRATGRRTDTTYTSPHTHVMVTGKRRWHSGESMNGHRAVLHLDTGEGVSIIRGIFNPDPITQGA